MTIIAKSRLKNSITPPHHISFNSVVAHAQKHSKELGVIIQEVIASGRFLNGPKKYQFEKHLRSFLKGGFVTAVGSGHDALFLALKSLNLQPHSEVIFPVNSYPTAFPIYLSGVKPIPVDVDKNGQLDIDEVKKKLNKNTKAVVLVHLYGLVTNIDLLKKILSRKKIMLIEDCAQAFGSKYKGQSVGTHGDIGCFSFYPTKTLGTLGDGGALWTKHKKIQDYFVKAVSYGEAKRFDSQFISGHSRIPEIQVGILNTYFKTNTKTFLKRKRNAAMYSKLINQKNLATYIKIFETHSNSDPVLYTFTVHVKKRNELQRFLKKKGITTEIYYPKNINHIKAFQKYISRTAKFPIADRLSKSIISLPLHEYLRDVEIKYIVDMIEVFYKKQ